jgi:hypothetical protein
VQTAVLVFGQTLINVAAEHLRERARPGGKDGPRGGPPPRTIRLGVYIYGLVDPRTQEVRYVGASVQPWRRRSEHLWEARSTSTTPKAVWLRDLLEAGLEPELRILAQTTRAAWREVEEAWIDRFPNLTNGGGNRPEAPESEGDEE